MCQIFILLHKHTTAAAFLHCVVRQGYKSGSTHLIMPWITAATAAADDTQTGRGRSSAIMLGLQGSGQGNKTLQLDCFIQVSWRRVKSQYPTGEILNGALEEKR